MISHKVKVYPSKIHLAKKKQLVAFKHKGFWKCMDVKRDRDQVSNIYKLNTFNWKKKFRKKNLLWLIQVIKK